MSRSILQPIEETLQTLEKCVAIDRRIIATSLAAFTVISYVFYNYAFIFSFIVCLFYPLVETPFIMSGQMSHREYRRIQAYWLLFVFSSLLDFTSLGEYPMFYFVKSVCFLFTFVNSQNLLDQIVVSLFGAASHLEAPRCPMSQKTETQVEKD